MTANRFKKLSVGFFCGILLPAFSPFSTANACNPHIDYYVKTAKTCNGYSVGHSEIWENYTQTCNCTPEKGCDCCPHTRRIKTAASWQIAQTGYDHGFFKCEKECLASPHQTGSPKYYDDPKNKTRQNSAAVNLPVVLAWEDDPDEWKNLGEYLTPYRDNAPTGINYGPNSYRVEIQYEEYENGDANLHIDKNKNPQGIQTLSDGQKIFYKIIAKSGLDGFNSRDDGGACFFQTNTTYKWRVRPCCDAAGTQCKTYRDDEGWWEFSTSPASELLGLTDKDKYTRGATDGIAQDPDWNGPAAMEGVDFCSAKLFWCKAKLADSSTDYHRFDKVYNENQPYAFNYQMRVMSSENTSLGALIEKIEKIPVLGGILGWIKNSGVISGIKSRWDEWQGEWSGAASECNKWMEPDLEKAAKSESAVGEYESEACHYLQRNADGTCAKPETLSFSSYFDKITNDASFMPFFSAAEKTSSDRHLFTGDWDGKLKYSWQIKTCFNTSPNTKDEKFPHCNGNIEEDYGQKWQLIGKPMSGSTIGKPTAAAPADNKNWTDENNLVGAGGTFNWTAPCGANSFLYDIQDETGKSIFDGDEICGADYKKDSGRRIGKSQITIALVEKDPKQDKDPGTVQLKIDTKYKWRVKSCWPSIPVGEAKNICSGQWSDYWSFRTTGKKPTIGSDAVKMAAPTATLTWEPVSGFGSYRLKIVGNGAPTDEILVTTNQFSFDYPGAKKNYSWRVKTCADSAGTICGEWQAGTSFNSEDFPVPANLSPAGNITQLPSALSWNGTDGYFWVAAQVNNGEKSTSCDPEWFNKEYAGKTVSGTDLAIKAAEKNASSHCAGDWTFTVRPCFDDKCAARSFNEARQTFSVAGKSESSGLMVCGQKSDDPGTPYNEKEPCEIKHIFLTLKVIIDFVMFKLALLLLPIMALVTGGLFYLAQDKTNLAARAKDIWKKIGIGYAILFFSWIIVSIIMALTGYGALWNQIL